MKKIRIEEVETAVSRKSKSGSGDPHAAELEIKLMKRPVRPEVPPEIAERNKRAAAKRDASYVKKHGGEASGLFAIERVLTFLTLISERTLPKLKLKDIHLFLLLGGEDGLSIPVVADLLAIHPQRVREQMIALVQRGLFIPKRKWIKGMGGYKKIGESTVLYYPLTAKGRRLQKDLASFNFGDIATLLRMSEEACEAKGDDRVEMKDRLAKALVQSRDDLLSGLSLDF